MVEPKEDQRVWRLPWVLIVSGLSAIGVGLGVSHYLDLVVELGHIIPQADIAVDYVIAVAWAIVLGVSIVVWPVRSTDKPALLCVWFAKSVVTLGFMLFYESSYGLDAYVYFDGSRDEPLMNSGIPADGSAGRVLAIARLFQYPLPESYHALKVSFSMVGLVAIYIFYRAMVLYLRRENTRVFYCAALFPSILFWSSIIGKDPLILLGIMLYVYGVIGWVRFSRLRYLCILISGVLVAMMVRVWMAPILFAPLILFPLSRLRDFVHRALFVSIVGAALVISTWIFVVMFQMGTIQDVIVRANDVAQNLSLGGSGQKIPVEFSSGWNMLGFIPIGAFTALFRPLPGEVFNGFGMLAGLENLFLLVLLGLAIVRTRFVELKDPVLIWAILLVAVWAVVYGFLSYHNLGTAVRYRSQILPIMLGLLLYLARRRLRLRPLQS